jgi:hypothetical protein
MAIKDILLPLVSYPDSTTIAAIDKCLAIAHHMGANISATAVELEFPPLPGPFTGAFVLEGAVAVEEAGEHQKSLLNSRHMFEGLEAAAESSKVSYSRTIVHCAVEDVTAVLVSQSRLKDLSLIPVKERDGGQEKLIESPLFESGRPVLLFSEHWVNRLSNSFDHVAIAWDHSAQAARAVADALPFLQRAKSVRVLTATDKATSAERESGASLVKHLARLF